MLRSGVLSAEEAPDAPSRLEEAIGYYKAGQHAEARSALTDLLTDGDLADPDLRTRARSYLGEVLYVEGETGAAWDAFRAILEENPRFRLDPYDHPPDIVDFFETVRAATVVSGIPNPLNPPPPTSPPAPFPWWGIAPLGVYQFTHDEPVKGSLFALGQVVFGTATLTLAVPLYQSTDCTTVEERDRLRLMKWGSVGTWAAMSGIYVAALVDAKGHWRRHRDEYTWTVAPNPQVPGLSLVIEP